MSSRKDTLKMEIDRSLELQTGQDQEMWNNKANFIFRQEIITFY